MAIREPSLEELEPRGTRPTANNNIEIMTNSTAREAGQECIREGKTRLVKIPTSGTDTRFAAGPAAM